VDIRTKEPFDAAFERSDVCAVAAASVVGEAMVLLTIGAAVLEKFGGDSLDELRRNVDGFKRQVEEYP
jgi:chorismate synthase